MDTLLRVDNLTKEFQRGPHTVEALNNVSFEMREGEFLVIMGTSGSGKSTMLNILGALDSPTKGTIFLKGESKKKSFEEPEATIYRKNNIGFIFQSFNLLNDLTVYENVSLPLMLNGLSTRDINQKVKDMLERVNLSQWSTHRPTELSGGQQQRVAIARALITNPPIILADEPTGNLDFNTSNEILHLLSDLNKEFKTSIILVTHDPKVASFADKILYFHDGKIVDHQVSKGDMKPILEKFERILEISGR